jgi:hypothetical protein
MQENTIHLFEPTPTLRSKKCRSLAKVLEYFLKYTTLASTLLSWYFFDYFIALMVLVLSYIIMGIIRSKLRNSVIPQNQREYQYNDEGIASWYVAKELCFEEDESIS